MAVVSCGTADWYFRGTVLACICSNCGFHVPVYIYGMRYDRWRTCERAYTSLFHMFPFYFSHSYLRNMIGTSGYLRNFRTVLYTILFKPIALGEFVIYLVKSTLGFGLYQVHHGRDLLLCLPIPRSHCSVSPDSLHHHGASIRIKITRSNKDPAQGFPNCSVFRRHACGAIVLPHIVLLATLIQERIVTKHSFRRYLSEPVSPLTLFRETPAALKPFTWESRTWTNPPTRPGPLLRAH
jgi:hypothetical protein